MCGISGGTTFEKAYKLYESNFDRGVFASGILAINKTDFFLHKVEGTFDKEKLIVMIPGSLKSYHYFLFHSRAPTNTTEPWSYTTTHPFNYEHWFAAQNGIITNASDFQEPFEVDSALIPVHLRNTTSIIKTFERYKGLLSSWLYNSREDKIYVVKAGSSLYKDENSFCTTSFEGSEEIPDGTIWSLQDNKLTQIDTFNYNNPYFIL